jgi:hypothetical protein
VTPFGIQRSPAEAAKDDGAAEPEGAQAPARSSTPFGPTKPSAVAAPATKATEAGDSIRFERPTPFGPYRWTKKKSELTPDEQKIWETQQSNPPAQADKR